MSNWREINKEVILKLKPCEDRLENYLKHYNDFNGDLSEFLDLEQISETDKISLAVRVMPRFLVEVFAIDCAVSALKYGDADSAAYAADSADSAADDAAAYAAAHAAYAAAHAARAAFYAAPYAHAAREKERQSQIEALHIIIEGE